MQGTLLAAVCMLLSAANLLDLWWRSRLRRPGTRNQIVVTVCEMDRRVHVAEEVGGVGLKQRPDSPLQRAGSKGFSKELFPVNVVDDKSGS